MSKVTETENRTCKLSYCLWRVFPITYVSQQRLLGALQRLTSAHRSRIAVDVNNINQIRTVPEQFNRTLC